tara:strand:+ start:2155 stop:3588 length:1434 start_codon:yes stop_codon:yes gene_type:complete
MKKKLINLSSILPNYVASLSHGALICEPLTSLCSPEHRLIDEVLPSSKDIFYAVDYSLWQKIDSNQSKIYTYNGVSSLTYLDTCLPNLISKIQKECNVHLTLICPKNKAQNIIEQEVILYDNLVSLNYQKNLEVSRIISRNLISKAISAIHLEHKKEIVLIRGYSAQQLRAISLFIFSIMPYAVVIAIDDWKDLTINNDVGDDLFVGDEVAIIPHNYPSYLNYKNSPLHNSSVTAIINLYKRYDSIPLIYYQLLGQTLPVSYIYVWVNSVTDKNKLDELRKQLPLARFIISDDNLGVWARFAYGLNNRTEYTVVFDDDTVPGSKWIENCIYHMDQKEALFGTVGLIYNSQKCYMDHRRIGWPSANPSPTLVDIVGHSWFFKTDWLRFYWYEFEPSSGNDFCGEDMHFSFALQKQGIPTVVPPHPLEDKELWGSLKPVELGTGSEAISVSGKGSHMDVPLQRLVARGFNLINFCEASE